MLLIILTLILLAAWYLSASALSADAPLSTRAVVAGTGATGQIAVTCMALGVTGWLTPAAVAAVTLLIAAGLVVVAVRMRSRTGVPGREPRLEPVPGPGSRPGSAH